MKNNYDVILYPMITEKGTEMSVHNKYQFVVAMASNKIEIKKAVEQIYNVKVKKVHTSTIKPKQKRVRREAGYTVMRKKALVTLETGHEIEFV